MSALRSREFRTISRRVLLWCDWYTRGLDELIARDRRDEIASDLHEHAAWADEEGLSPRQCRRQVLRRMIAGLPADLAWRSAQLRTRTAPQRVAFAPRSIERMTGAAAGLAGSLLVAFGLFLLVRIARALLIGDVAQAPSATAGVGAFALIALGGTALLSRERTRWAGALLLAPTAFVLAVLGADVLYRVSATGTALIARLSDHSGGIEPWVLVAGGIGAGAALGFVGAAVLWWPARERPLMTSGGERMEEMA